MSKALKFVGAFCFVMLLGVSTSMAIGIDCNGNPNMNPIKAINMAAKGMCAK